MAGSKQGLNRGFFGPAIPPRHAARKSSRSCCCCYGCCGCRWLCCTLFKILLFIVLLLGIVVLILWLVLRPNQGQIFVQKATLQQFDLNSGSLSYKLTTEISIKNPNERISLNYDYMEVIAYYGDSRLKNTTLSPFVQGHKNMTMIYPAFQGQVPALGKDVVTAFEKETKAGFFNVKISIRAEAQYKVLFIKSKKYNPHAECKLHLPVPGSSGRFELTKCDVHLF